MSLDDHPPTAPAETFDSLHSAVVQMAQEVLDTVDEAALPRRAGVPHRFIPVRLLPPGPGPNMVDSASPNSDRLRAASVAPWWDADDDRISDDSVDELSIDEFTEYTLDSHPDEVSVSTQASTRATRPGFVVMVGASVGFAGHEVLTLYYEV
eukprot:Skav235035  [mRNA]  locus=scaffold287:118324:132099:+ [translate_table: standard]